MIDDVGRAGCGRVSYATMLLARASECSCRVEGQRRLHRCPVSSSCESGSARNGQGAASCVARPARCSACLLPRRDIVPSRIRYASQACARLEQRSALSIAGCRFPRSSRLARMISPPGFRTRANSSSVASGRGTVDTTYCAITTSKELSGKSRLLASITASCSTWVRPIPLTRIRAFSSMSAEISDSDDLIFR